MHPIKEFDSLPDDAVVPRRVTAAVLHVSERTVRRSVPTVKVSPRRRGNRVGVTARLLAATTTRKQLKHLRAIKPGTRSNRGRAAKS